MTGQSRRETRAAAVVGGGRRDSDTLHTARRSVRGVLRLGMTYTAFGIPVMGSLDVGAVARGAWTGGV